MLLVLGNEVMWTETRLKFIFTCLRFSGIGIDGRQCVDRTKSRGQRRWGHHSLRRGGLLNLDKLSTDSISGFAPRQWRNRRKPELFLIS